MNDLNLKSLWRDMPTFIKVAFVGRFVVYGAIVYIVLHSIGKLW